LRLDQQLCFALHAASRAMTAAYRPLLAELDVTYTQYLVLLILWEEDGARVSRLGDRLALDSATLTPLLKRLEARGYVTRQRSQSDERVVEVFLTPEGKRLERKAASVPTGIFQRSKMTKAQLEELRDTLKSLTRTLNEPDPTG
ncbi:MAG: MarR family transcriptional regulator, partial [Myxococcales bacterium]